MFKPSDNYLIAAGKQSRTPKNKIVVDGVEYLGDVLKTSPKISGCMTALGDFPIKECSFEIYNFDNLNLINKEVTVFKGLTLEDGTVEYIQQGIFKATQDNITTSSTKKTIFFKGKDKATVFDNYYGGENLIEYPTTWGAFIQEICDRRGVTLETPEFPLYDQVLEKRPNFDINSITERTIISQAAQLSGSVVQISRLGGLRIEKPVETGKTIKRLHYKSLNKENKYGPVNVVALGIEEGTDDIVYKNEESITINGETIKKINNNCFVSLNREAYIDLIGAQWDGIEFYPFNLENMIDDYCFDLGDVVMIVDKNNQEFKTIILAYETTSRIFCKLCTNTQENSQLNYKLAGSSKGQMEQIKMSVNHLKNEFDVTATLVNGQSDRISQINLSLNQIQETVSQTNTELANVTNEVTNTVTATEQKIEVIEKQIADGVENLKNSLVTIDINGINVATNVEEFKALLNNKYVLISDSGEEIAFFGYDEILQKTIARIKELETERMTAAYHRCEPFKDDVTSEKRSGWFYIGGIS
ncbi:MAG: hypothetical protein J6J11_01635 [Treponema sp.]|nr:hypothetical protein [Treponema sp.]